MKLLSVPTGGAFDCWRKPYKIRDFIASGIGRLGPNEI